MQYTSMLEPFVPATKALPPNATQFPTPAADVIVRGMLRSGRRDQPSVVVSDREETNQKP